MKDDRTMDTFDAVVAELFGSMVDPRELYDVVSKQNDASEVHVLTPAQKKAKQEKRQAQVGLASNVLGLAAGGAAVVAAARNPALRKTVPKVGGPITQRAGKYLKTDAGRARLYRVGAGGALGLQVANTAGDVVANRVLARESKKKVAKALGDIVDARRKGRISTETAIQMSAELVEKLDTSAKGIFDTVDQIAGEMPSKKIQVANEGLQAGAKVASKGKKLVAKKPIALAKKPVAQPITPNEAEPVTKSDGPEITWSGEIAKMDSSKRQVFGFAMVTHIDGEPVIDRQGDYTPLEEIEKAAYTYVIESRKGGDMHERDGDNPRHTADLMESFVITPEKLAQMGLEENALPHGWWVGFKVNDDKQWEDVVAKRRTGFSIHGSGRRVEKVMG